MGILGLIEMIFVVVWNLIEANTMTNSEQPEPRWIQRFRNFQRAFLLLGEVVAADIDTLTKLEQEAQYHALSLLLN